MNFKKYLTYMLVLSALMGGGMAQGKESLSKTVEEGKEITSLTPYQQEVRRQAMDTKMYPKLRPSIRDNLDFSKVSVEFSNEDEERPADKDIIIDYVFIPAGSNDEFGLFFQFCREPHKKLYQEFKKYQDFVAIYKVLRPEYLLPQYPQNEQYKKLSEKRFKIPPSAEKDLTPEQFEEVTTIMRVVKKDIDFLMNEPFYDVNEEGYRSGEYVGKLYGDRTIYVNKERHKDFKPYFKERETPLEFELNNRLGRFLSMQEISEFDNKIEHFGACYGGYSIPNYGSDGGYIVRGTLGDPIVFDREDEDWRVTETVNKIKRKGLYGTNQGFSWLISGIGEIIKERGVDPENLPNIKSPNVPVYDKCLAYIYMQAKEVHDIVMETNVLNPSEEAKRSGYALNGTLADYVSIDPKSPGLIKQKKTKIAKAKNKPQRQTRRQK